MTTSNFYIVMCVRICIDLSKIVATGNYLVPKVYFLISKVCKNPLEPKLICKNFRQFKLR